MIAPVVLFLLLFLLIFLLVSILLLIMVRMVSFGGGGAGAGKGFSGVGGGGGDRKIGILSSSHKNDMKTLKKQHNHIRPNHKNTTRNPNPSQTSKYF